MSRHEHFSGVTLYALRWYPPFAVYAHVEIVFLPRGAAHLPHTEVRSPSSWSEVEKLQTPLFWKRTLPPRSRPRIIIHRGL